jgi:hypothetical protein
MPASGAEYRKFYPEMTNIFFLIISNGINAEYRCHLPVIIAIIWLDK